MDAPAGPSKSVERKCLICGNKATSCHLGVDACRACTVFYRRARNRKMYACRSNTRRCRIDPEGSTTCKRCRFDRFEQVLRESGAKELIESSLSQPEEHEPSSPVPAALPSPGPLSVPSPMSECLLQTPGTSSAFSPVSPSIRKERAILEKCKLNYKLLNSVRRTSELNVRPNAPHPLEMTELECPVYPATFGALNSSTKITLSSILEFATGMFPEFLQIPREERWSLVVNFFYRFESFESCYRGHKRFPDDLDRVFGSYTTYFDKTIVENFYDDCSTAKPENLEEAKKFLYDLIDRLVRPGRTAILRVDPDENEFYAVLVILFWFTDGDDLVRDEVAQIGEKYRANVLQELHAYYREDLGLSDYATRVGELFMLILHFERNKDLKEHFEICRMLGIFNDDTFVYQLQKD